MSQVTDFVNAVPDFIDDITAGRGPLGWLQDDYQIVDRIREAIEKQGVGGVLGLSEPVLDVVRSVVTAVVGAITIIFLTFFMLLEGPRTIEGVLGSAPRARPAALRARRTRHLPDDLRLRDREPPHQPRWPACSPTIVLFAVGSEFAIALGLLVAILDLIPLAGATLAAIIVSTVVFIETDWIRCLIVIAFFVAYQQFENHVAAAARLREDGAALAPRRALRGARRRAARGHPRRSPRDPGRGLAARDRARDPAVPPGDRGRAVRHVVLRSHTGALSGCLACAPSATLG